MREIPKKNYIIMFIIVVSVVLLTHISCNIYNTKYRKTSILTSYLSEIKMKDLDTYLMEKPNSIIYISSNSVTNNEQELKLKDKLIELNITDYIVYLNIDNKDNLKKFNQKFNSNIKIDKLPIIVIIEDNKITKEYSVDSVDLIEMVGVK